MTPEGASLDSISRILFPIGCARKKGVSKNSLRGVLRGGFQFRRQIERKSISDFMQSLLSGRLENQFRKLSAEPLPMLLITGSWKDVQHFYKRGKITEDHLIGAIASGIVRFGLRSVIWIQGDTGVPHNDGLLLATTILKKVAEGKLDEIKDRRIKRTDNPHREVVKLLLNVPSNVAENLLKKFKTIRGIINAPDQDLLGVSGIGPSRLERIRFMLDNYG